MPQWLLLVTALSIRGSDCWLKIKQMSVKPFHSMQEMSARGNSSTVDKANVKVNVNCHTF